MTSVWLSYLDMGAINWSYFGLKYSFTIKNGSLKNYRDTVIKKDT